jgi:transcription-repair coupling factor (superfamily II helicase)
VGFDLYVRMIGEAVGELRDAGPAERAEVRVELPVNAHIPHSYVPGERLRLEAYTRIAAVDSDADIAAVYEELSDRYGPPPEPVAGLLAVARLRAQARHAGLTDIAQQGTHIRFAPVELPESRQVRVQRLYPKTVLKPTVRTMLVPVPRTGQGTSGGASVALGGPLLRDRELVTWCGQLIEAVFGEQGTPAPQGPPA